MKIKSLKISDFKPIKHLSLDNLGDTIIIAGSNGSGKTRLKQAIVNTIQGTTIMDITIEATRPEEEDPKYFAGKTITVITGKPNNILNNYINSRKFGLGRFVGSLVQIDSNREIHAFKYSPVNWLGGDPDDTESLSNFYFSPFINRWQDFMNYIHQKAASRDKKLADELKKNPKNGEQIIRDNPDPLDKYKKIFSEVLPDKKLFDIDPAKPREFYYSDASGQSLPFTSLSSGEQEVIKVLFDFARKEIRHSIILVDEPELHLHPTLTFKLIESLKALGEHTNQFIFFTHSADLISTYYSTGDVYFIDTVQTGENQAHKLSELNDKHNQVVKLVGQNLGVFAVGKKLIFVEGEDSSIDRLSYHTLAQTIDPELKIIPIGSVINILTLNTLEEQIRNSIFGINLFMIRDRDGLSENQINEIEKGGKIHCLKKRHLENYFLDEEILFLVADQLYLTKINPTLTRDFIKSELFKIAQSSINFNLFKNTKEYLILNYIFETPKVKTVETKTMDDLKEEIVNGTSLYVTNLASDLDPLKLRAWLNKEEIKLKSMLTNNNWMTYYHGKYIFSKFCADVLKENPLKVQQAYVDIALSLKPDVFKDILDFFKLIK